MSKPATATRTFGRDCLMALSLANLTLLRVWSALLARDPDAGYTSRHPARPVELIAAVLVLGSLAALFCIAATVARRFSGGRVVLHWGTVLALALPLNALREVMVNSSAGEVGTATIRNGSWRVMLVAAVLIGTAVAAVAMILWRERVARALSAMLLIVSPFLLVTLSDAVLAVARYHAAACADRAPAMAGAGGLPRRRVLWLIFDEMDERLAFARRDPGQRLPEFDRFRAESFSATNAWSPARVTMLSLPALLGGKRVIAAKALAPDDLLVTYDSGQTAHWQDQPNLFSLAHEQGFDSALAGWYHPYGRTLNRNLTACVWVELPTPYNSLGDNLPEIVAAEARSLVETTLLSPFGQSLSIRHQVRNYREVLRAATAYSTDPKLGVVFLHFPIPHPPYIYNARTQRFDLTNSPVRGYIDALALADRTFGELRRSMESAGVWDRTAVLVSADHGYRADRSVDGGRITDRWVPFLLKLPGHQPPYEYRTLLETVRSADLLLEILEGKISTPAEVAAALDPSRPPVSAVRK